MKRSMGLVCDFYAVIAVVLEAGDFVFFFYAGHAIQWEDQNYLIPCDDTNIQDTYDLKYRAINVQRFLERLSSRKP